MKLTVLQIEGISQYLEKDKIFYDDIRHEMTDHIATTLEEQIEQTGEDFDVALKAYMHSHLKVKLLTEIREQEVMRDTEYRNKIFRGLVSKQGLMVFGLIFCFIMFSVIEIWVYKFFLAIVMVINMIYMAFEPWMAPRFHFIRRIFNISLFYHWIPLLFVLQGERFFPDSWFMQAVSGLVTSVLLTAYFLLVKMNNKMLKEKKNYV